MKTRVTVHDIATHAGVSIGTVDRVMHNRSGVSPASRQKVLDAMEQLGYRLNTTASLLANKKHYRICCLLPKYTAGDYWGLVHGAIGRAESDAAHYNLSIETIDYDQFSRNDFLAAVERLKANPPQGVIMAPIYHSDTIELSHYLAEHKIPLVFIDSKVAEAEYMAYYGLPMFESGYLAASLLLGDSTPESIVNFRIERGATEVDNPTLNRRQGFLDYIALHHPTLDIYNEFLRPYDRGYNFELMDRFFAAHPEVRHVVTFNSRVHLIADYLAERQMGSSMNVVGFDLLERNCEALRSGAVRWLIVQRTEVQLRRGVDALAERLAFGKLLAQRDNFMPMDILTSANIEYYSELYKG